MSSNVPEELNMWFPAYLARPLVCTVTHIGMPLGYGVTVALIREIRPFIFALLVRILLNQTNNRHLRHTGLFRPALNLVNLMILVKCTYRKIAHPLVARLIRMNLHKVFYYFLDFFLNSNRNAFSTLLLLSPLPHSLCNFFLT